MFSSSDHVTLPFDIFIFFDTQIEEALERKLLELLSGYDYYDNAADNFLYDPSNDLNSYLQPSADDLNDYYQQLNMDYYQQQPMMMSPEEYQRQVAAARQGDYGNMMFDPSYYGDEEMQFAPQQQRPRDSDNAVNDNMAARRFLDYYRDMQWKEK